MKQIEELIDAFEMYYSPSNRKMIYGPAQRAEITKRFIWIGNQFKLALYDEVISIHNSSLRSLPDVAVIVEAMGKMGSPESYETPRTALPEPEVDAEDMEASVQRALAEAAGKAPPDLIKDTRGEPNRYERQRIRTKVDKGDATQFEAWWIHIIDDLGGKWEAMPEDWPGIVKVGAS